MSQQGWDWIIEADGLEQALIVAGLPTARFLGGLAWQGLAKVETANDRATAIRYARARYSSFAMRDFQFRLAQALGLPLQEKQRRAQCPGGV
jgi:hypothetical protein